MTRRFLLGIIIAITGVGVYLFWYTLPKSVAWETNGIKYQLGTNVNDQVQTVPISIKGVLTRDLKGRTSFEGSFDPNGVTLPIPQSSSVLIADLDNRYGSPMIYYYFDEYYRTRTYSAGVLYNDYNEYEIIQDFIGTLEDEDITPRNYNY